MAGAHVNLGAAYNRLGRRADAIKASQQGLKLNPESAAGHYQLGIAHLKSGQAERAREQVQQLQKLNPELARELQQLISK